MGKTFSNRARIALPIETIAEFSHRWGIVEFAIFGSVLRADFRPDSDVDVLVSFASAARPSLNDWIEMQDELKVMFGRDVDLVDRESIERGLNWDRRNLLPRPVRNV